MTYREPIAPNPEPSEPEPKEPFDFDKVKPLIARGILWAAAASGPVLLVAGVITGRESLLIPGALLSGADALVAIGWAANEVMWR